MDELYPTPTSQPILIRAQPGSAAASPSGSKTGRGSTPSAHSNTSPPAHSNTSSPRPTSSQHPKPHPSKKISVGAIVGIVFASLVLLGLLVGLALFFRRRRRAKKEHPKGHEDLLAPPKTTPVMNGLSDRPNMFAPSPQQEGPDTRFGNSGRSGTEGRDTATESQRSPTITDPQGNHISLGSGNAYGYYGSATQNQAITQVPGFPQPVTNNGDSNHPASLNPGPAFAANPDPETPSVPQQPNSTALPTVGADSPVAPGPTRNDSGGSAPPPYQG